MHTLFCTHIIRWHSSYSKLQVLSCLPDSLGSSPAVELFLQTSDDNLDSCANILEEAYNVRKFMPFSDICSLPICIMLTFPFLFLLMVNIWDNNSKSFKSLTAWFEQGIHVKKDMVLNLHKLVYLQHTQELVPCLKVLLGTSVGQSVRVR